jgi:lipopolysaccharide/colanic/teichoic acid biosynthesis glycosyltransferase
VYPTAGRAGDDEQAPRGPHADARSNGSGNGRLAERPAATANGHAQPVATDLAASNHKRFATHLGDHDRLAANSSPAQEAGDVVDSRWPVRDLWSILDVPTPLWKRSLDISLSLLALLILLPLFVLIAIAIRLDSPGPVIFRQLRAGRGARPFVFYKFRSMVVDAESQREQLAARNERDGPVFKIRKDPRITRLGRLLRRGSIDELPQLWNVLKGDISLVGPRSPTFDEVCQYEPWQRRRLSVTGGITCIWQVSGRSEVSFRDWMRLDMQYVACRNLWLDLKLLAQTLPAVISGRGAC